MTRLPQPGSDNGIWGQLLNDYLSQAHNADGSLKSSIIGTTQLQDNSVSTAKLQDSSITGTQIADGGIPKTKLDTTTQSAIDTVADKYTKPASGIPKTDLTSTIQTSLTTADNRDAIKLQGTNIDGSAPTNGQVLVYSNTSSSWLPGTVTSTTVNDATTTSKGIVQLAGDLAGTASSPTVPTLTTKADKTTTISGIGLTGGGDLSANRTLTVTYGTTASTAAQGNDSRITGAASDTVVVHKAGTETITGAKDFTGGITVNSTNVVVTSDSRLTDSRVPTGAASGDLSGTYPSPTVAKLNGITVTGTPSNGQTLTATSTTAASWATASTTDANAVHKGDLVINVRDYGAVRDWNGTSGTDNLAAFNAATTAAVALGGLAIIYIPSGRYWLSNNWIIDGENVSVKCSPAAELLTTSATTYGNTVAFIGYGVLSPNNVTTPQRTSFSWTGGKITSSGSGGLDNALGAVRVKSCHVSDVILDADKKGFTAQYGVDNIVCERIRVTRASDGVTVETGCNAVTLRDITVESATGAGVSITSGDVSSHCTDVTIDNIRVISAGTSGISVGLSDRVTIRKTRVVAAGTQGMYLESVTGLSICGDSTFPSIVFGPSVTHAKPTKVAIALTNSWVSFGAPYDDPCAYKTSDGFLVLDGALKSGTLSAGTRIGGLPVGYRPAFRTRFMAVDAGGAAATADLYIEPAGGIYIAQTLSSSTILSLGGITIPLL